jgi:hypothetical protein
VAAIAVFAVVGAGLGGRTAAAAGTADMDGTGGAATDTRLGRTMAAAITGVTTATTAATTTAVGSIAAPFRRAAPIGGGGITIACIDRAASR